MEAFPNIQTVEAFVTQKSEMHPQSHTLDFHNKADGHERRLATYVVENFRLTNDLEVSWFLCPLKKLVLIKTEIHPSHTASAS